jgi:hypothetical protein
LNLVNLEKLVLSSLFILVVIIASIKYFIVGDISANWTNVIFIIGSLFTARKAFSYFEKDTYNQDFNFDDLDTQYSISHNEEGDI